jgi:hypothetical protein
MSINDTKFAKGQVVHNEAEGYCLISAGPAMLGDRFYYVKPDGTQKESHLPEEANKWSVFSDNEQDELKKEHVTKACQDTFNFLDKIK